MAIRAKIIAMGPKIQKIGYRDKVQEIARELKIKGFVENLKDGRVKIICEGEEDVIEKFVGRLRVKEDYIEVGRVNVVEKTEAKGDFEYFDIKYGDIREEFGERAGALMTYMKDLGEGVKQVGQSVNSMHKGMNGRFNEMAEKYGEISTFLRDIKEDFRRLVDHFVKKGGPN